MDKTKNKKKKKPYGLTACGGKGKRGCSWAGATVGITKLKIAA